MFSRTKRNKGAEIPQAPRTSATPAQNRQVPPSIISSNMRVSGNLLSEGDVQIDGIIDGDICSLHLTVGENAVVNGSIIGERVRISGTVNGEITARVVELSSKARVTGDVNHDSLSIEAGAYLQGLCKRVEINLPPFDVSAEPGSIKAFSEGTEYKSSTSPSVGSDMTAAEEGERSGSVKSDAEAKSGQKQPSGDDNTSIGMTSPAGDSALFKNPSE